MILKKRQDFENSLVSNLSKNKTTKNKQTQQQQQQIMLTLNPERAGLFGPISQPGGGGGGGGVDSAPPRSQKLIDKNIKCVVLVDSYDPPESIGTKKKYKHTLYDATVMS